MALNNLLSESQKRKKTVVYCDASLKFLINCNFPSGEVCCCPLKICALFLHCIALRVRNRTSRSVVEGTETYFGKQSFDFHLKNASLDFLSFGNSLQSNKCLINLLKKVDSSYLKSKVSRFWG